MLRRLSQALLSRPKLLQARLLDIRKKIFAVKVVKLRSRCPEAVKSPSLEKLSMKQEPALSNLT